MYINLGRIDNFIMRLSTHKHSSLHLFRSPLISFISLPYFEEIRSCTHFVKCTLKYFFHFWWVCGDGDSKWYIFNFGDSHLLLVYNSSCDPNKCLTYSKDMVCLERKLYSWATHQLKKKNWVPFKSP
jgi:hypothetical protein